METIGKFFSTYACLLFLLFFSFYSSGILSQTNRYVEISGVDSGECDDPNHPCLTIQYAIGQANGGDLIYVSSGVYNENVSINKPLTLIGANENNDCNSRVTESVIAPASGAPVTITSDEVTINGFEINAPNHGVAIELSNTSNISILYNNVNSIGTDIGFGGPPTNSNTVHAIRYQLDAGSYANIDVSYNCISNISHSGNTFNSASGIGFLQSTSQGTLNDITIENNSIEDVNANTGNWGDGGRIAYGILINVGGNSNFETNGKVENVTIIGNSISNLEGYISTGIGLEGNTENTVVSGNTVLGLTGHKVSNRGGGGYDLQALKFENNRYVGTVTVENNSFQTNTFMHSDPDGVGYAVANYVPADPHGTVDVSCNWLGTDDVFEIMDKEDLNGRILAKEGAEIDFTPFLVSDDIDDPDCSGQGPVFNVNQGIHFLSIQDAINEADEGDEIELNPGVYNENLIIDKSLTILGPNATVSPNTGSRQTEAIIRPNAGSYGIEGQMDGLEVVIQGITLDGQDLDEIMFRVQGFSDNKWTFEKNIISNYAGPSNHMFQINIMTDSEFIIDDNRFIDNGVSNGIRMQQQSVKDITITNNVWLNNQGWALNLTGVRGTIANNEFIDTEGNHSEWFYYQHGMALAGNQNDLTISNNNFDGVYKAINFYDDATYFGGTAVITGNIFANAADIAIYVRNEDANPGLDISGVSLTDNYFSGNELAISNPISQNLNATCNWWGTVSANEILDAFEGDVDFEPFLSSGDDSGSAAPGFSPTGDCDGCVGGTVVNITQGTFYCSIQAAINDADEGDQIEVGSGTYEETLAIVEVADITIIGEDKETTILKANNSDLLNWPDYHQHAARKTAVLIDRSTDINIQNITFDFDNVGTGSGHTGLMMWNSTGSFEGNAFINRGIAGQQVDINAYVGADETTLYGHSNRANVSFIENEFVNTGRIGLNAQDFVFLTVEDNDFTKTFDDPGYGVEMASLSNGLIKGNSFSNFNTTFSDGSTSSAIYIHNNFTQDITTPLVKQVDVVDNAIDNSTYGIYIGSTSGGTHWGLIGNVTLESEVSGNTVTSSEIAGVFVTDDGASLGSGVTVDFKNNSIDGGDYGYHLNTYWGDGDITVSISNDNISNVGTGVFVIDYNNYYNDPSDSEYDIEVFESSITSFSEFAIRNQFDEITVTATCNWYGSADAGIIAASISGEVDFFPWLTDGTDDEPGEMGFTPLEGACDVEIFVQLENSTDPICPGGSDGSIDVTVSDGQPPYSFSWEGPGGFTSTDQNISDLPAGVHSLTVTDNASNSAEFSIEIFDPIGEVEVDQIAAIGPLCAGNQLEVSFSATGFGSSHTFEWNSDNIEIGPASGSGDIDFTLSNATSEAQTANISVVATSDLGCESDPMTFQVTVACVTISGIIADLEGIPMEGVTVTMTGDDNQSTETDEFGEYTFDQAAGDNFIVEPDFGQVFQTPADLSNFGVSSADATAILNHLNGSEILSGIPLISADTRSTNNVTGADRAVIVFGLLGNPAAINFWNIQSWFFIEEDHDFNNPDIPWDYASSIIVQGANGNIDNVNFEGIRKGDVTGTIAAVDDFYNGSTRYMDIVNILMKEQDLQSEQLVEVEVKVSDFVGITSLQLALQFDPYILEFSELIMGTALPELNEQNIGLYNVDEGIIRLVWATSTNNAQSINPDEVLFTLVFENPISDGLKLSDVMSVATNDIMSMAFAQNIELPIELLFEEALATDDWGNAKNQLYAITKPNPFSENALIELNMPKAGEVQFEIFSADGKLINKFYRILGHGPNQVVIDNQLISHPGLYFIRLSAESETTIMRILKSEK
ncbi:MAG: T9SS C-terminal target domain-containing protein [Saprospirales bacterium]|nr:MAG: T9SS C-terminal target domain-containing protein [Saprospirales bacterium]